MNSAITYHACFDVKYHDQFAIIGYVLFENHASHVAFRTGQVRHDKVEPYVSGEFYKRELPCLLTAIHQIPEVMDLIYVDGNVWLDNDNKGLGCYLYEALNMKIPVIGISKTAFHNSEKNVYPVLRANSKKPLYISSIGMEPTLAARSVAEMHGAFRLPTMIKLADTMSREEFSESRK